MPREVLTRDELLSDLRKRGVFANETDLNLFEYFGLATPFRKLVRVPPPAELLRDLDAGTPAAATTSVQLGDPEFTLALTSPLKNSRSEISLSLWAEFANTSTSGRWLGRGRRRQWDPDNRHEVLSIYYLSTDVQLITGLIAHTCVHVNALAMTHDESRVLARELTRRKSRFKLSADPERDVRFFQCYLQEIKSGRGAWKRIGDRLPPDGRSDLVGADNNATTQAKDLVRRYKAHVKRQVIYGEGGPFLLRDGRSRDEAVRDAARRWRCEPAAIELCLKERP